MRVLCKFKCTQVSPPDGPGPYSASFQAVHSGSPENDQFFALTPSGSLTLGVVRAQHFVAGQEYYLTLEPAVAGTVDRAVVAADQARGVAGT